MTYRVIITREAETDLRTSYRYILSQAPRAARDWIRRVRQCAKSLARRPERWPLATASASFSQPFRQLFFCTGNRGIDRCFFVVLGQTVYILHTRDGSMLLL